MVSQPILIVVIIILGLVVVAILFPLFYKIFTGKSANLACKSLAGKFELYVPVIPVAKFAPFVPLCDLFAPF